MLWGRDVAFGDLVAHKRHGVDDVGSFGVFCFEAVTDGGLSGAPQLLGSQALGDGAAVG